MKNYAKKSLKSNNGITLIALVITIIVLLILAGVTISLALNNNGVIERAQYASNSYANAAMEERTALNEMADEVARLSKRGDDGEEGGNTSTIVFKNGTETVTTPEVGYDVEIGTEKFKVIKITGNKVTAIPYYNLDLTEINTKQQTSGDTARDAEQNVSFSTLSEVTWGYGDNIMLGETESAVTTPITNYETYLKGIGANNIEAKIGRFYNTSSAHQGIDVPDEEYIGDCDDLNPSGVGRYWLGTSSGDMNDYVFVVYEDGYAFSSGYTRKIWRTPYHNYQPILNQKEANPNDVDTF